MSDGGKGSKPRPFSVGQEEYDTRWDAIFGRDLEKETAIKKLDAEKTLMSSRTENERLDLYKAKS